MSKNAIKTHKDLDVWNKAMELAEMETQLLLATRLRLIDSFSLLGEVESVRKILLGLIRFMKGKI